MEVKQSLNNQLLKQIFTEKRGESVVTQDHIYTQDTLDRTCDCPPSFPGKLSLPSEHQSGRLVGFRHWGFTCVMFLVFIPRRLPATVEEVDNQHGVGSQLWNLSGFGSSGWDCWEFVDSSGSENSLWSAGDEEALLLCIR